MHRPNRSLFVVLGAVAALAATAAPALADPTDTQPPTAPTRPRVTDLTCNSATFSWRASTDDVGVIAYDVFHDGQLVQTVDGDTLTTPVVVAQGVKWGFYVDARDAAGNTSQSSPTVYVTPPLCQADDTPPTTPGAPSATADGTTVTVTWGASRDDVGVRSYDVLRDGVVVSTINGSSGFPAATSWTDVGLPPDSTFRYTVVARDPSGNRSERSTVAAARTGARCTTDVCGVDRVATSTDIPWGLATLPDGTVLYNRRDSHEVVSLDPATGTQRKVGTVPGVQSTGGEGGLLGLAVAPTFARDRWVYLFHTTATDNRIVRIKLLNGRLVQRTEQVLLTGILRNTFHDGGRLRFGPDGKLYAATGDAQNGDNAQNLQSLNGKVLRINPDGTIPADNPFGTAVWSYGHRNPQGLAFDSQGRLWEQEFGNTVMDETNLIRKGGNYGWPACEGTSGACGDPAFVAPVQTYPTALGSCSGIAIVADILYVACQRGNRVYREVIAGGDLTDVTTYLLGTYGRLRTVEPAPGGGLWLTTTNDRDHVPGNSTEQILRVTLGS